MLLSVQWAGVPVKAVATWRGGSRGFYAQGSRGRRCGHGGYSSLQMGRQGRGTVLGGVNYNIVHVTCGTCSRTKDEGSTNLCVVLVAVIGEVTGTDNPSFIT